MLLAVGPNSAIDEVFRTNGFCPQGGARVSESRAFAGGKAANAAHVAVLEGLRSRLIGFVGGVHGRTFRALLADRGVEPRLISIRGETRRTFCFLDADGNHPTLAVEEGPRVVRNDVVRLENARLVRLARAAGCPVVVDTHGEPLRRVVFGSGARPDVLVPNEHEFLQLMGRSPRRVFSERTLIRDARSLLERGIGAVVLKRGDNGLLYIDRERELRVQGRKCVGNATGSGDVVTAHVASALARGETIPDSLERAVAAAAANVAHDEPGAYTEAAVRRLLRGVRVTHLAG